MRQRLMEWIIGLGFMLATAYLCLLLYAAFFAHRAVFPRIAPSYSQSEQIITLNTPSGLRLAALYLPARGVSRTILYSHGNGEDIGRILPTLKQLRRYGCNVFAYDYPGYGLSDGEANEKSVNEAIVTAYRFLTENWNVNPDHIIVWGRSVGGGPSAYLASRHPVGGIVLESTFRSVFRVVFPFPFLPWEMFPVEKYARQINVPALVIHGGRDEIIPIAHGEAVLQALAGEKSYLWVNEAGHNNVQPIAGDSFDASIRRFLDTISRN